MKIASIFAKPRTTATLALSAALALFQMSARASSETAVPIGPEVKNLSRLVGSWTGTGTFSVDKEVHKVTGTWTCKSTAAGYAVRCDLVAAGVPGLGKLEEAEILGFDQAGGEVHWTSACNAGEVHDLRGSFAGDALKVKDAREEIALTFSKPNKFAIRVANTGGGPVFDMTFSK